MLASVIGLALVGAEWASNGFGALGRAYETALLVTGLGLGIQIVFAAFFLALLTMPLRREPHADSSGRRDLGRHPGQGRRRRPRALPRGDLATADRRRGRGRRGRLGLAGRERRSARRASARASTRFRASEFHHGRTRNLGAEPRARRDARLHEPGRVRRRRRVAREPHGSAPRTTRSRACTDGSCRTRTPRRPSATSSTSSTGPEPRVQRLDAERRAELRGDAVLERELRDPAPRLGGVSRSRTTSS